MNDDEFENESNSSASDSGNDISDSNDNSELPGNEEEGSSESEGTSEVDYSELLTDISGTCDNISAQVEVLNDNVVILNENLKFGIGLLFVIVFFLMIKTAYHIIGSILGLNKA